MQQSDTKVPNLVALLCALAGLFIGAVGGLGSGSIAGAVIAGLGVIPACWGIWAGMQREGQGSMAISILLLLLALGVAGLLLILRLVHWIS